MESLIGILPWIQITLAVLLTVLILIQQRGAGAGGAFGGSTDGTIHFERRGFEKTLFKFTGILAVAFVLSVLAQAFVKDDTANYYPDIDTTPITIDMDDTDHEILDLDVTTDTDTPISASDLIDFEISNQDVPEGTSDI